MSDKDTIQCSYCDCEVWDDYTGREEMQLHEAECDGGNSPQQRFDRGDRVKLSDYGQYRLDREPRQGEVVGFGRQNNAHCVRVLWDDRESPQGLAHRFVKPVQANEPASRKVRDTLRQTFKVLRK